MEQIFKKASEEFLAGKFKRENNGDKIYQNMIDGCYVEIEKTENKISVNISNQSGELAARFVYEKETLYAVMPEGSELKEEQVINLLKKMIKTI